MVPGVKVDLGKGPLTGSPGDMISYGLDGLAQRLEKYQQQGACFAKWRSVYNITEHNPTSLALSANAEVLARYAAECQAAGMVPIVEPEVLIDGNHSIQDRKSTRLNSSHVAISYAVFCLKKKHYTD